MTISKSHTITLTLTAEEASQLKMLANNNAVPPTGYPRLAAFQSDLWAALDAHGVKLGNAIA